MAGCRQRRRRRLDATDSHITPALMAIFAPGFAAAPCATPPPFRYDAISQLSPPRYDYLLQADAD